MGGVSLDIPILYLGWWSWVQRDEIQMGQLFSQYLSSLQNWPTDRCVLAASLPLDCQISLVAGSSHSMLKFQGRQFQVDAGGKNQTWWKSVSTLLPWKFCLRGASWIPAARMPPGTASSAHLQDNTSKAPNVCHSAVTSKHHGWMNCGHSSQIWYN